MKGVCPICHQSGLYLQMAIHWREAHPEYKFTARKKRDGIGQALCCAYGDLKGAGSFTSLAAHYRHKHPELLHPEDASNEQNKHREYLHPEDASNEQPEDASNEQTDYSVEKVADVISSLLNSLNQLRIKCGELEAKILSLEKELDEERQKSTKKEQEKSRLLESINQAQQYLAKGD